MNAKAAIFKYRQAPGQGTTDYYESFKELISVLESYGGKLHDPEGAAPASAKIGDLPDDAAREAFMRDRYCATVFLRNADKQRFDQLRTELSNDFSKGRDEYPTTCTNAHQLLLTYGPKRKPWPRGKLGNQQSKVTPAGAAGNEWRTDVPTEAAEGAAGTVARAETNTVAAGEGMGGVSSRTPTASHMLKTISPTESRITTCY